MINREKHDRMANAIRFLSMDAVEKANSGHPGLPMGCADIATVLFTRFLKYDPKNPHWPDRDRFVLSAGHGSMLLYSLLYLTGYEDMTIDQIKNFRQLGSKTAGHPEYGHAAGIETTTGPLGQGLANSVGMALAERIMNAAVRRRPRRPPHLCAGRRRLPDGRHQPGSDRARRPPQAQQADRLLGQQRHLHRRPGVAVRLDRPGRALRGLRLEHASRIDGHDPDAIAAAIEAAQQVRPADADRLPRRRSASARRPRPAPTSRAWLAARRGGNRRRPQGARLGLSALRSPGRHPRRLARWPGSARRKPRSDWEKRLAEADADSAPSSSAACAATCPADFDDAIAAYKKKLAADKPKVATRKSSRDGAGGHQRRRARNDRRLGRPDRLQQHQDQPDQADQRRRLRQPLYPLRHPRARHGGGHERHGAAWRRHSLWRHLPVLHRLCAAGDAARRADGHPRRSSS